MSHRYLEVTFRDGRALAGYLYLPRRPGDRSVRSERRGGGLLIDFAEDGRPLGVEITAPSALTLDALNCVLSEVHEAPATTEELSPLHAA